MCGVFRSYASRVELEDFQRYFLSQKDIALLEHPDRTEAPRMNPPAVAISLIYVLLVDVMDTVAISRSTAAHVEEAESDVLAQLGVGQVLPQEQVGPLFGRASQASQGGNDQAKEAHTAARSTTL
jgi:hypothetical protein